MKSGPRIPKLAQRPQSSENIYPGDTAPLMGQMLAVSHEDLSSDPQILHKKPHTQCHVPLTSVLVGQRQKDLWACWPGNLAELAQVSNKACIKKLRRRSTTLLCACAHSEQVRQRHPKHRSSTPNLKFLFLFF